MKQVSIAGGGPAGASAAITAIQAGAAAHVIERGRMPRHKVCGEFLSPEIVPLLERLGVSTPFEDFAPARVRRMIVRIGNREKITRLPEPAFGLSRYRFDHLLLEKATENGAQVHLAGSNANVIATGRSSSQPRGDRFFGFKAHFEGPTDDAVELYFFDGCYVGLNCIEGGSTNVCGLGPEALLQEHGFDIDALVRRGQALTRRIDPLRRSMKWLFSGPLEFGNRLQATREDAYLAGDALSFVDPFTGTGLVSAVATGSLAGRYAAAGVPVDEYVRKCRQMLARPFEVSSTLRWIASTAWAERLLESVPGQLLYWATRPILSRRQRIL